MAEKDPRAAPKGKVKEKAKARELIRVRFAVEPGAQREIVGGLRLRRARKATERTKGLTKDLEKATTKEKDKTARGRVRPRNAGNVAKRDT